MGVFPYKCELCGGSYRRCGYSEHTNCNGGQFCYESSVVLNVNGKIIKGVYDGYGRVKTEEGIYIPSEFNPFINVWGESLKYEPEKTSVCIYCSTCYKNRYSY